jgi:8-oxo-dGTP diphosphatase
MPRSAPIGALPCVTIDCSIFGFNDFEVKVLLIRRGIEPQAGMWGLPGGWVFEDEDLDDAALRILEEATGVPDVYMEQTKVFGRTDRFPDGRIVTIGYTALINPKNYVLRHGLETSDVRWFGLDEIPQLTFDHREILNTALEHLKERIRRQPISFELLPSKFTLPQIISLYESVLGMEMDRRNFRRKLLGMNILEVLDEKQTGKAHRAARFYRFDKENYKKLQKEGFVFDF